MGEGFGGLRVTVNSWRMFYVHESPHSNVNTKSVCVPTTLSARLLTHFDLPSSDVFTHCRARGGLLFIMSLINLQRVFPQSLNQWSVVIHHPSVCDRELPLGQTAKSSSKAEETPKHAAVLHPGKYKVLFVFILC